MPSRSTTLRTAAVLALLAFVFTLAACDRTSDQDQQVAELEQQVSDLQAELEQTNATLDDAQQQNVDLTEELSDTQGQLATTKKELGTAEAELLDAQAQLATVGELVLADGTYVGRVLGAKASPYRVIVFDAGGLYRVAQVSDDPTITAGNSDYTLTQFGKLLSSTDPDNAKLANGNYRVIVKDGLATSIRKSKK